MRPIASRAICLVGTVRIEFTTFGLRVRCYYLLSYIPMVGAVWL